jgi:hypothetical protein
VLSLLLALATSGASVARADGPLSFVGNVPLNAKAHGVALQGNLAYVATEKGLTILDIADPARPFIVGVLQPRPPLFPSTLLKSQAIAVAGDYAYLAAANLIVVDVRNPAAPVPVGKRAVPGGLWDVAVKDDVVYGASLGGELYVLNVANKGNPVVARVIGLPAWAHPAHDAYFLDRLRTGVTAGNAKVTGVSLAGDGLFAVDWAYGRLYYYDITDRLRPTFVATHYAPYLIKAYADRDPDLPGARVYMLTAFGAVSGLRSVPVSVLEQVESSRYTACASCGYLKSRFAIDQGDLAVTDNGYVVYAGGKGAGEFHIVDTAPAMQAVASDDIGLHGVGMAHGIGLRIRGDYVLQAAGVLGLQVYRFAGLSQ